MNTRKHKNKNRPRPKVISEIKTEDISENLDIIEQKDSARSENSEKGEIIESAEPKCEVKEYVQEPTTICEVPKKPKRKKGKKKLDEWVEETVSDSNEKLIEENVDKKTENEDNMATIPARKKKNKGKKTEIAVNIVQKPVLEENITESENKTKPPSVASNEKVTDEVRKCEATETDTKETTAAKKKKKKKNRHDSDKSEINESCTLAFQKLLEPTNIENEEGNSLQNSVVVQVQEDDSKIVDFLSSEEKITDILDNKEHIKGKRKQNKNKNASIETETNEEIKNKQDNIILSADTIKSENITESEIIAELSPKLKAKIAKPVQKRKVKSELENFLDSTDNKHDKNANIYKLEDTIENNPQKCHIDEQKEAVDDTINKPEIKNLAEKAQNIIEEDNGLLLRSETSDDNSGFIEVKAGKHKKKPIQISDERVVPNDSITVEVKNNNVLQQNLEKSDLLCDIPQIDIKESFKSEELEGLKVATPDLIQYPRSTSQLNIDDNNNTLIQEITVSDEIKLGIPVYVSTPVIEGSGETPEVRITEEPIKLSQGKQKNYKANIEKIDIKSKMFEVNKEMEELRRSIERSLAGLTGSEACDSKVDKEFEKIFQSQREEESKLTLAPDGGHEQEMVKPQSKIQDPENINSFEIQDIFTAVTTDENKDDTTIQRQTKKNNIGHTAPVCPARTKSKGKSKRKSKEEPLQTNTSTSETQGASTSSQVSQSEAIKTSDKTKQKTGNRNNSSSNEKGKQHSSDISNSEVAAKNLSLDLSFEPIENFEDALTSSAEDVNKTFDIIANEATQNAEHLHYKDTPQINVIAPSEDGEDDKGKSFKTKSPISQPKNLLGRPNIPVSSNKNDFKKEKNKPPSSIQAKVKVKDSNTIEKAEKQHNSQTKALIEEANGHSGFSYMLNENENVVYKYNFRNVFLQSTCHFCKKDLIRRVTCKFCSLVFYCSQKHKDDDWPKHQSLCFAVCTISHLKEQKFIYADITNLTGHEYRLLRMQMILSCEKIMKRKLVPWEQEALLYARMCGDVVCREWKQSRLKDCEGCGQISYCIDHPEHLPADHKQWCKSYRLYQKMVKYQQTKGRVEPKLPTRVLSHYRIPDNLNEVLGSMYEEKIDMDDIHYAALTQIATAPLTTAFSYQIYSSEINSTKTNGLSKKSTFTIHSIANDVQFEADFLNKWEIFFLHLIDSQNLRVVLIGMDLNPNNLPLDIIGKIRLCENCKINQRRVTFDFHDKQSYEDYYASDDFSAPDIVCAFNPNIQRTSTYKIEDIWPMTLKYIFKQRVPFLLTSYTLNELKRDIDRVKEYSKIDFKIISEPKSNPFTSVRPDRNFITDHEIPLLFKNYCFSIMCGV